MNGSLVLYRAALIETHDGNSRIGALVADFATGLLGDRDGAAHVGHDFGVAGE